MNQEVSEDKYYIFLNFRIPRVLPSKISSTLTDFFLKINVLEEKFLKIFDFSLEIDSSSPENKLEFEGGICKGKLVKRSPEIWGKLVLDSRTEKEEVRKRRAEGLQRLEETQKAFYENKSKILIEHDRHSTTEMMRIEGIERKAQEEEKERIHREAEFEIFKDLDDEGKFGNEEVIPQYLNIPSGINQLKDINKSQSNVRESKSLLLNFTEKVYPHIAMRESQLKDAPLPRIKALAKASKDEIGLKNPLWLKDKGDEFVVNGDYLSALNAYTSALALRPEFEACIANRAFTYLKLSEPDGVIKDGILLRDILSKAKESQPKPILTKTIIRMALAHTMKGEFEEAKGLIEEAKADSNYSESDFKGEELLARISQRESVMKMKSEGDALYKMGNYTGARDLYTKALQNEPDNEWVLVNLALVEIKSSNFTKSLEYLQTIRSHLHSFLRSKIHFDLLTKLNLRTSACYQGMGNSLEAIGPLEEILAFDPSNTEVRKQLTSIQAKEREKEGLRFKDEATEALKSKDYALALELLEKAQKLLDVELHCLQFLAILVNKCSCFTFFSMFDDVITVCLRGIRICRSVKSRVTSFLSPEDKKQLEGFEIRFLVRRSNAYIQQNQFICYNLRIYNAKGDLEDALKLDPMNSSLKADLEKLRVLIN